MLSRQEMAVGLLSLWSTVHEDGRLPIEGRQGRFFSRSEGKGPVRARAFRDEDPRLSHNPYIIMLRWAIGFLIVALVAGALGFGGIAGTATGIAKILFFVFLILFAISLVFGRK
jgi:uncharacterized membrane protein YtjA (UPF0391 family)